MNTDAVSMLKIKKPKISQFEIILTYSHYNVLVYYNKITHASHTDHPYLTHHPFKICLFRTKRRD